MSAAGTLVIVGAGPGIGASVARRFAREGYAVGLVARNAERLTRLAAELREATGATVSTATADATDAEAVQVALGSVAADLGEVTVLCYSPIPDLELIRPVLETGPQQLLASFALGVAGAAAAVDAVLPGMRERGHGSLLFTTGSAALAPHPDRAASAVTTTAATSYVSLLHQALAGHGIRVGHTVIVGPVAPGRSDAHDPDVVAADLWRHHSGTSDAHQTVLHLAPGATAQPNSGAVDDTS